MIEPKLRFKADDGSQFPDWEEKTFNDVADYKKGPFGSALKKEIFVPKSNDTVKVYEQQNAISKDWKLERYFVTNEYFQLKMKPFAVSGGDIIVSCAGTIGEMYELPDDAEEGIINQALMRVRIKKPVINSIIFRCAFDKMISTEGVKISNGSALKNIPPFADMKKQSVFVPSLPEQQKIADFLSTIDTVIEKQKATVEAWKERKKGVIQKLFSQEVRFKADDGSEFPDWEEKKIEDVATCFAGATPSTKVPEYWMNGTIQWMSSGEVNNGQIYETEKKISQLGFDKCSTKMVKPNTVVMALAGQGKTRGMVAITRTSLCTNQSLCAIETIDDICDDYLYQYLQTQYDNLRLISSGDGIRGGLNLKLVGGYVIKIPCLAEQQKIADCLSSLDDVIEKQKATLAAWEEMKKGLLQQMFV